MELLKLLSAAEKRKVRKAVAKQLEKYRMYSTTAFTRKEAKVTPSYEPRFHGPTNKTGDQTGVAAAYNVDKSREREAFCRKVEQAVSHLPEKERFLMTERYTSKDSQYATDLMVYNFKFDPPISHITYGVIRDRAMIKLALILEIDCGVDLNEKLY